MAEALLAITLLVVGASILGTILMNASGSTAISKDYLIAQNLATEGVEAVKNIRDTNWLRMPNDKKCWLALDPDINCADNTSPTYTSYNDMSYIAGQNNKGWWSLSKGTESGLDLSNNPDSSTNTKFRLYINGGGKYVHDQAFTSSPFFREVRFTDATELMATFNVKVQWVEGKKVRTISRDKCTIYNSYE